MNKLKGFKPLVDYVHSQGLPVGILIIGDLIFAGTGHKSACKGYCHRQFGRFVESGMYRSDTSTPGGRACYDSIIKRYASRGVDDLIGAKVQSYSKIIK